MQMVLRLIGLRISPYGLPAEGMTGFPFRFTGQKVDEATGLYYYKARFYDPETGRFLQTDPIGYEDQMNLYGYVGNDPINRYDPTGLRAGGTSICDSSITSRCFVSGGSQGGALPKEKPSEAPKDKPANDNNHASNDNKKQKQKSKIPRALRRILGLVGVASVLEESNNRQNLLFRGLSATDITNLQTIGALLPNDINGNLTPEEHALSSEGSQFISFTTDRTVAINFANSGPNPGGIVVSIDATGAAMSGRLVIPNVARFTDPAAKANVISEGEVLVIGPVPIQALRSMERVGRIGSN